MRQQKDSGWAFRGVELLRARLPMRRDHAERLTRWGVVPSRLILFAACLVALPLAFTAGEDRVPSDADQVAPRAPWTTSRVVGSPQPPLPYLTENAFPELSFQQPVEILPIPETDRLLVAGLRGRIDSFQRLPESGDSKSHEPELFFDLLAHVPELTHLYGLAFHPQFAENRQLYVCYVLPAGREDGSRISRFRVLDTNPPRVDPASEEIVLTWASGGHNGGCLQFGPDGYLYVSTGDGVGPNPPDPQGAGQDLSNLFSSILRIDVDRSESSRPYAVPADNPFVEMPGAKPEIWAYGFRNPWRMSFDPSSGDLWVGDVGWELWEMIYRVTRGGNYGWSVMEGRQPINPDAPRGPTPIQPPTVDHSHTEAASITGGMVYWGERLPELRGAYIYGDYETGKIWGLRLNPQGKVSWHEELADTSLKLVSFGVDRAQELYLLDHTGSIHRLIPNPNAGQASTFPRTLSDTGLFTSVPDQQPAAGVVPYSINAPMWQDGATSRRWIALPGNSRVEAKDGKWTFPEGAVLVKTLSLSGAGGQTVNVETQLLHFNGSDWNGYSYRWNELQQDAELVPEEGDQATWNLGTVAADQQPQPVEWQYNSRADCLRCHNPWSGPPLAFDAMHLGRDLSHGAPDGIQKSPHNQLEWLDAVAVTQQAAARVDRSTLVNPHDSEPSLDQRARSYLHVNCAHCHRIHAGGAVLAQMTFDLPIDKTQMVDALPTQGDLGIKDARVIRPGDPGRSVLLHRIAKSGQGRMPRLGSHEIDAAGLSLLYRWVEQMEPDGKVRSGETAATSPTAPGREVPDWLASFANDASAGAPQLAKLLRSPADALQVVLALDRDILKPHQRERLVAAAAEHPEPLIRDLFERFLPKAQQRQRLGDRIDPQSILAMEGDAERGEKMFFANGLLQCNQCHKIADRGKSLGPDLNDIGGKRSREELLQSLLVPSEKIEPVYQTYLVQTVDGRVLSGLLVERTAERVKLADIEHRQVEIMTADIDQMIVSPQSLMPDGVLRELTAQEAADLLAFLTTLRSEDPEGR